jgi:hypothetical protein
MTGRWMRYSLALVGVALVVAFVLPTGYTINLLVLLEYLLLLISFTFTLLFAVFVTPLARLLFGGEGPDTELPSLPEAPEALSEPGSSAPAWLSLLRSLIFWAAVIGVVIYVVRAYLRDHPQVWKAISSLSLFRALGRLLAALWRRLGGLASAVRERIPRALSRRRARRRAREDRTPSFRLGALSPRGRVRYYYLSILHRAGRKGVPRHPSQTPYEYDGDLEPHLPAARQEMADLTGAFVEARYSQHPLGRKEEKEIRARWKRVKAALRALGREKDDAG